MVFLNKSRSALSKILPKVNAVLKKNHTIRFLDVFKFMFNLIFSYVIYFLAIFITIYMSCKNRPGVSDELTFISLQRTDWMLAFFIPLGLVVFSYLREYTKTQKAHKRVKGKAIIYKIMAGAVISLIELTSHIRKLPKEQVDIYRKSYRSQLLRIIEKVIEAILEEESIEIGNLSSNVMVKDGELLVVDVVGTPIAGREYKSIRVDPDDPLPGAPSAYVSGKVVYINNTACSEYNNCFDLNKDYRSIISYPIEDLSGSIYAIVNIDSPIIDQFISKDFVEKEIVSTLMPFMHLFRLKNEIAIHKKGEHTDKHKL